MGSIKNYVQIKKKLNLFTSEDEYSHIYRRKTLWEMMRLSFAIMGIEFTYAALTAFVSPILLELGVDYQQMTMVWAISPVIGFFLSPAMGSLSDRCRLRFGRRRPFMILFAIINVTGLLAIPYGESFATVVQIITPTTPEEMDKLRTQYRLMQSIAIAITIFGVVFADYSSDALQNPSRAYLLDVCRTDDHARGLTTFTVMAGLGGFIGYLLGSIDWTKITIFDSIFHGTLFNGHIQAFYTITAVMFSICILTTITTFKEVPLKIIETIDMGPSNTEKGNSEFHEELKEITPINVKQPSYGCNEEKPITEKFSPTLKDYLRSILIMPHSLKMLCVTNLFCWMAQVSYSLYFTDFVGEAIFGGDPSAPKDSEERTLYEDGVRFACLGMAVYSLSCMCCSFAIESLIKRFGLKNIYIGNILIDAVSLMSMAIFRSKIAVIILSVGCGVLYATLFTVPYILVAHYHTSNVFEIDSCGDPVSQKQIRGLGTDVSVIGSCVFVAQFTVSMCMGAIVAYAQTTTAVVITGSILAVCAAFSATKVMYLDL